MDNSLVLLNSTNEDNVASAVLILVVMDNSLVRVFTLRYSCRTFVLILVVMDNSLVQLLDDNDINQDEIVLILVVMDNSLVQKYQ